LAIAALLEQQVGDAAGGVAAGRDLAAVYVEDAHPRLGAAGGRGRRRRLNGEQLFAADADLGIADPDYVVFPEGAAIGAPVEDDEMVAQAVHLDERPLGSVGRRNVANVHGAAIRSIPSMYFRRARMQRAGEHERPLPKPLPR